MKKTFIILSVFCVMLLTGCSTDYAKVCQEDIEEYNKKQVKQTEESEVVDQGEEDNICTLTVDKEQKRVMRKYEKEGLTTILSQESDKWYSYTNVGDGKWSKNEEVTLSGEEPLTAADIDISEEATYNVEGKEKKWYSYTNVGDGKWSKNEEVTLSGEEPLTAADIDISEEATYNVEGKEKVGDRKAVKVEVTTPVEENIAAEMKENGQITDTLLENEEFKKAYDDVVNEKEQVSYIWIDTKTKEMIKMETKENGQITDTLLENEEFKKAYDDVVNEKEQVSYIWIDTKTKEMIKMETDVTKKKVFLQLENEEFKKAYDDVVNEKEQVSYIWIDTKTKEMIKMETDVTKKKVFLHYYMKLVMEAPTYEELPSSVTKVITYSADDSIDSIEIPKEK